MSQTPSLDAATIEAIKQLAQSAAGDFKPMALNAPEGATGIPAEIEVLLKTGAQPEIKGLKDYFDPYRFAPERRKGAANVTTLQSFIDLINRHKDDDSAIFASTVYPNLKLSAVIDYHTLEHAPRFGTHKVDYAFPLTEEFKSWIDHNNAVMSQGEFAEFLEENIADLASPYDHEAIEYEEKFRTKIALPNDMMGLSRGLHVKVNSVVKNALVLQSGEAEISFTEEHSNDKGEKLVVPGLFMISLPAFIDGDDVRLLARLRYRVAGGGIKWSYHLYKWDFEIRNRVKDDLDKAANETGLPAFEGAPEK